MVNHVVLVGKVVKQFELTISLEVNGENIVVYGSENLDIPNFQIGDIIGIRGRVAEGGIIIFDKLTHIVRE